MKSREFRRLRRTRSLGTAGINGLLNFFQGDLPCEYLARLIRNHDAVASISQREVANEIALMEKGENLIVGQVPGQAHIAHSKTLFKGRESALDGGARHSQLSQQFQRFRLDAQGFGLLRGLRRAIDNAAADATTPQVVDQRQANRPRSNDQNVMCGSSEGQITHLLASFRVGTVIFTRM